MRISERGQITIPKELRDLFGLKGDVEIEITPTEDGLLVRKRAEPDEPVDPMDRVYGVLGQSGIVADLGGVDAYIRQIRGY